MLTQCQNANSRSAIRSSSERMSFSPLPSIAQVCQSMPQLVDSREKLRTALQQERLGRVLLNMRFWNNLEFPMRRFLNSRIPNTGSNSSHLRDKKTWSHSVYMSTGEDLLLLLTLIPSMIHLSDGNSIHWRLLIRSSSVNATQFIQKSMDSHAQIMIDQREKELVLRSTLWSRLNALNYPKAWRKSSQAKTFIL